MPRNLAKTILRGTVSAVVLAGLLPAALANRAEAFTTADHQMLATARIFVGLADVRPGMTHYWGMRAASAALRGQNAIQLTGPAGAWTENEATGVTTGDLVLGVQGATCNITTVICTVTLWYDPIGGFTESGVSSGNVAGTFVPNCTGRNKPCVRSATGNAIYGTASTITYTQPFSHVAYARRSSGTGFQTINSSPTLSAQLAMTFNNAANQFVIFAGGSVTTPVAETDGVFHAFAGTFNGASSIVSVDGVATTGLNPGTGAGTTTMCLFRLGCNGVVSGQAVNGDISEFGTYPTTGLSASDDVAVAANQTAYW